MIPSLLIKGKRFKVGKPGKISADQFAKLATQLTVEHLDTVTSEERKQRIREFEHTVNDISQNNLSKPSGSSDSGQLSSARRHAKP